MESISSKKKTNNRFTPNEGSWRPLSQSMAIQSHGIVLEDRTIVVRKSVEKMEMAPMTMATNMNVNYAKTIIQVRG